MGYMECKNVSKSFGTHGVFQDFNVSFEKGRIYGLLGRNGAGKTTLLNLLSTRYLPDAGEITIGGEPIYENESMLSNLCYMSAHVDGFVGLSVKEIMNRGRMVYSNWNDVTMKHLLQQYDISESSQYHLLSTGKATAVGIVVALSSGCDIIFLDEIYSGLDAVARQQFYKDLLADREEHERTYLLSTHLIEEMDHLFTDIVMINQGTVTVNGSLEEVLEKGLVLTGRSDVLANFPSLPIVKQEQMGQMTKAIVYGELSKSRGKELMAQGVHVEQASLQELFIALAERKGE